MASPRTRARWLLGLLCLLTATALLLALYGCGATGRGGGLSHWLGLAPVDPGPSGGGSGDGVPGVWGGLGDSISTAAGQIRWWFALGGFACFGVGVYKLVSGQVWTAAKCLGATIALGVVGSIASALFESVAWLVVIGCGVVGVYAAVQWGRGGSVLGHSWGCVVGWLSGGRLGHKRKHDPSGQDWRGVK